MRNSICERAKRGALSGHRARREGPTEVSMEEISVGHGFGERGRKDRAGESCDNETECPV